MLAVDVTERLGSTELEMTRISFAQELESAADRIADMSRADLQIILRRAGIDTPQRRWCAA
ncbi:hypothetical protein NKI86_07010 [Mesorhizobium sp. M0320]|uniref:hypothetical protein n=1 Tax=Mesorhizobium sp. M0320 TaxID=2956936 RepID=UPI003338386A